jgi:protease IV
MRDFFKHTFASLLALFIFLGIGVGGLLALVLVAASGSKDVTPQVKDKSVLVMDMNQPIVDSEPDLSAQDVVQEALSGRGGRGGLTLREVIHSIDSAAKDGKIVALYLFARNSALGNPTGYANLKEIREALERFKTSGKKIYAYDVDWQEKDFYLASVADQVAINPVGSLEINGLSSETTFYAGALQKFGVGVQAIWRGKYKSAVEPFLRDKRSDASREQTEKLLNDIWGEFITTASKSRGMSAEALQKVTNTKGYLTAQEAKAAKLVDRLAYTDEMIEELKKLAGTDEEDKTFRQISLNSYADVVADTFYKTDGEAVAVVYAEGEIVNGMGDPTQIGGDRLARQIRKLRLDPKVKAVVLRVNTPGGSATASEIIQREVILTKKVKPVVVSMGSTAASGGYWISTYGSRIFAEPNTITGSIGVFGLQPNFQKLANDNGVTWDVVKTGKFADSRTVSRPKTQEEIAVIQRIIGDIYDQFVTKVAQSRKLDPKKVAEIAQGRVWSGLEAKKLGLVDEIGGLNQAIAAAAKLAKLDRWHVMESMRSPGFEERILRSLVGGQIRESQQSLENPLAQQLDVMQADLQMLKSMNDPRGIYMRLPENLRIQ